MPLVSRSSEENAAMPVSGWQGERSLERARRCTARKGSTPRTPSLPVPTDFLAFLSHRAAGHPLQLGQELSLEPRGVQTVPALAQIEAAARVEGTKPSAQM